MDRLHQSKTINPHALIYVPLNRAEIERTARENKTSLSGGITAFERLIFSEVAAGLLKKKSICLATNLLNWQHLREHRSVQCWKCEAGQVLKKDKKKKTEENNNYKSQNQVSFFLLFSICSLWLTCVPYVQCLHFYDMTIDLNNKYNKNTLQLCPLKPTGSRCFRFSFFFWCHAVVCLHNLGKISFSIKPSSVKQTQLSPIMGGRIAVKFHHPPPQFSLL